MGCPSSLTSLAVVLLAALASGGCTEDDAAPQAPPNLQSGGGGTQSDSVDTGSGGEIASGGAIDVDLVDGNPLVGSWNHDVDVSCSYTHTFTVEGDYIITSTTGERVESSYTLMPPVEAGGRHRLDFTVTFDNNVVDCEGDRIDGTGMQRTGWVTVMDDVARVYLQEQGGGLFFEMTRL